ncbi:MAG: dTMP kinase [Proteobacteria bacterium]|nr:dTMP kinase [Pseudomonadota bacterium]NBX85826.1 dTMP kinase [Pseudomonadota bacterium]
MNTRTPAKGHFIVLEGGEGVGKTTQITLLHRAMEAAKLSARAVREPGSTKVGELLRPLLKGYAYPEINEWQALCGYNFARTAYIFEVVQPALAEGVWMLSDRFAFSTIVYQGYAGGLDEAVVQAVTNGVVGNHWPSLTFILDAPAEVGLARSATDTHASRQDGSRYEDKGLTFHQKIRNGYLKLLEEYPHKTIKIDATQSVAQVHQNILQALNQRFALNLQPVQI